MITSVLAQMGGSGDFLIQIFPFILIFAIIYFLIIRPQQKRAADHRKMVESVRRGDIVVTSGGIVGKVTKVQEDSGEISVEIAEGVKVKVIRSTLSEVRSKGEPVPSTKEGEKAGGGSN